MPNLEQHAVTEWLTELRPAASARVAAARPGGRDRGGQPGAPASVRISPRSARRKRPEDFSAALRQAPLRDDLRAVMAQLGAARLMRLLHWLAEIDLPDCNAVISALVGGDDATGHALRAAIAAVTRRALLRRIFAPDRIAALQAACEIPLEGGA